MTTGGRESSVGARVELSSALSGMSDFLDDQVVAAVFDDALALRHDVAMLDDEVRRDAAQRFVLDECQLDSLDAVDTGALTDELGVVDDCVERFVDLFEPLVDAPKQGLVASGSIYSRLVCVWIGPHCSVRLPDNVVPLERPDDLLTLAAWMPTDHNEVVRLRGYGFPLSTIDLHPSVTELIRALAEERQPRDPLVGRVAKMLVASAEESLIRLSALVARSHRRQFP